MSLENLFEKRIIVCAGSGGVGKTTTAATLALQAAKSGKKAVVLTIDPARRLATALGIDALDNSPKEIKIEGAKGQLFAMMLDTKTTFDRLIEKHTKDPEKRKTIFQNRLYQHMSSMIAGSQEYMAMEKLYELHNDSRFDVLILDTPPTRHALDFLEAPTKMINLTGNSLLEWFLKPGLFAGKIGFGLLQKGAEKIMSVFDRLAGFAFLNELAEMLSLLGNLLGGFHDRAKEVYDFLKEDFTGFVLVTTPSSVAIQDALYFHEKMKDYGLHFLGFIVNRVHEELGEDVDKKLSPLPINLKTKMKQQVRLFQDLVIKDKKMIVMLKKMGGKKVFYQEIPLLAGDVHDLEGLEKMRRELF